MSDDGEVMTIRVGDYKFNLSVQRAHAMRLWAEPFTKLRLPFIMNLRRDPFELAEINSNTYLDWMVDHVPQLYMMQAVVAGELANFQKFPPRQKPASFILDAVMEQLSHGASATGK
jgi:arylsulfatase